jgi:Mg2+/Co2+ transporter CorB
MSPDQRLAAIADRLVSITSPALRTAVALEIFGKAGVQIQSPGIP